MHDFLNPGRPGHFWRKATRHLEPNEAEMAVIEHVESNGRPVERGAQIQRVGEPVRAMYIVRSGAFLESRITRDGRRQIQRVLFAGDVIGGHDIALRSHTGDVHAVTDSEVVEYPRSNRPNPGISRFRRLFYAFRMVDQAVLADRIQSVARADGETRLLHFLLELNDRQRLTCPQIGDWVWLPLTQSDIGDALGLTNVYVSKLFGVLRRRGVLTPHDDMVELHDRERLIDQIGFEERYDSIDPAWLDFGFSRGLPTGEIGSMETRSVAAE